jgi:hypothetical protein
MWDLLILGNFCHLKFKRNLKNSMQNWATKYVLNAIGHTKEIGHFKRKDPSHERLTKTLLIYWAACGWDGGPT